MRLAPLLLSVLLACTVTKGDTDGGGTTFGDAAPFTSTDGMSSMPPASTSTTDPSMPTIPPTGASLEPDPSMVTLEPTTDVLTGGQTSEPPGPDLPPGSSSGDYLLAVSTVVSTDLPFQFLTTVDASEPGLWTLILQPLSLDIGQTGSPRQPVGDPLVFTDVPVMNGQFTLDLGEVLLAGSTNPITGSDITATITLFNEQTDADSFCGAVSGEVTSPLMTSIDGSTYAAVRVAGLDDLPDAITINCAGDTVMTP